MRKREEPFMVRRVVMARIMAGPIRRLTRGSSPSISRQNGLQSPRNGTWDQGAQDSGLADNRNV
eukprot:1365971-Amorphochlora_amoeboformis.AAC.1